MTHGQKEKRNRELIDMYELGLARKPRKTVIKFLTWYSKLSSRQVRNIINNWEKEKNRGERA